MPRDGSKNLKPMNKRSKSEVKEIASRGGINSGKSRRARKTLREELLALLSDGNTQERVSVALIDAAIDGDVKAFVALRDTIGEKPVDKVEQNISGITIDFSDIKNNED